MTDATSPKKDDASVVLPAAPAVVDAKKDEANKTPPASADKK